MSFRSSRIVSSPSDSSMHSCLPLAVLSLMSSLFDSFFGFIFWGAAYFQMRKADGRVVFLQDKSLWGWTLAIFNAFIILIGVFFLTLGTYASVEGIKEAFQSGSVGDPFTCTSAGL